MLAIVTAAALALATIHATPPAESIPMGWAENVHQDDDEPAELPCAAPPSGSSDSQIFCFHLRCSWWQHAHAKCGPNVFCQQTVAWEYWAFIWECYPPVAH